MNDLSQYFNLDSRALARRDSIAFDTDPSQSINHILWVRSRNTDLLPYACHVNLFNRSRIFSKRDPILILEGYILQHLERTHLLSQYKEECCLLNRSLGAVEVLGAFDFLRPACTLMQQLSANPSTVFELNCRLYPKAHCFCENSSERLTLQIQSTA